MQRLLHELKVLKSAYATLPLQEIKIAILRRESILKSAVSSVRITPSVQFFNLLPRRAEIVEVIRDHKMVSFDFIARRFRRVPTRTLHYDLAQLIRAGYVKRLGATRGAQYIIGDRNS